MLFSDSSKIIGRVRFSSKVPAGVRLCQKLEDHWSTALGVGRNFSRGVNVDILHMVFRLLAKQCKRTFTKHFTFSKPQRKCVMLEVYWLQYNIAMRKKNTANVYSQLGLRKNPEVI